MNPCWNSLPLFGQTLLSVPQTHTLVLPLHCESSLIEKHDVTHNRHWQLTACMCYTYLGPFRSRRILEQIPESLAQPAELRLTEVLLLCARRLLTALVSQRQSQNEGRGKRGNRRENPIWISPLFNVDNSLIRSSFLVTNLRYFWLSRRCEFFSAGKPR